MKIILILLFALSLKATILNYDIKPSSLKSNQYMNIKILDSKELKFEDFNNIEVDELSALAYNDEKLYALSNRGYLFHFNISIKNDKIKNLHVENAYELKNKNANRLKKIKRDAEGLVFVKNKLYMSFEREPRVDVFSLNGVKIKKHKINKDLRDIDNYQGKNRALESIAYNSKYGIVTAPELPLIKEDENLHVLYAKNDLWKFKLSGRLSAIEFIDKDRILTLERTFNKWTRKRVVILKEVNLSIKDGDISKTRILAELSSSENWNLDNFEGLCRVSKNKFLMVSDSNRSFFQKTLLVLFEVLD